jgi:arylsulfatase A-like enzyme
LTGGISPIRQRPYNLTTDLADDAIKYMRGLNAAAPDKPFFLYYVPGGTHAPHQPTPEWIKKISDMHLFDKGWNDLREQIFANQKRLGVIPANTQLTPWPDGQPAFGGASLPKWETLSPDEKKLFIRQADVFAAYVAYTDNEIGRVIQEVKDEGKLDNTLIIYIAGDNGTSAEGSTVGTPFDMAAIECQRPVHPLHAVLRDDGQPRHLPRWLDRRYDAAPGALADGRGQVARRGQRLQLGALQHRGRLLGVQRPRRQDA